MTKSLVEAHQPLCPDGFVSYKQDCFLHISELANYDKAEVNCAFHGSRIVAIKERSTYQFLRSWAMASKFGNVFLGFNFTLPVRYSDGQVYNKSVDYSFDGDSAKFGNKECAYLKKGVKYKPRDCMCDEVMEQVCIWNSKYSSLLAGKIYFVQKQDQLVQQTTSYSHQKQMEEPATQEQLVSLPQISIK